MRTKAFRGLRKRSCDMPQSSLLADVSHWLTEEDRDGVRCESIPWEKDLGIHRHDSVSLHPSASNWLEMEPFRHKPSVSLPNAISCLQGLLAAAFADERDHPSAAALKRKHWSQSSGFQHHIHLVAKMQISHLSPASNCIFNQEVVPICLSLILYICHWLRFSLANLRVIGYLGWRINRATENKLWRRFALKYFGGE